MKRLVIAAAALILVVGCAALPKPLAQSELGDVQQIVELPSLTKDEIFDKSKIWFANTFKSAQDVIQYENKEKGTIIGRGNVKTSIYGSAPMTLGFQVTTNAKDNKARIILDQFTLTYQYGDRGIYSNEWPYHFKPDLELIAAEYASFMKNQAKKENW